MSELANLALLSAGLVGLSIIFLSAGAWALRPNTQVRARLQRYMGSESRLAPAASDARLAEPFMRRAVLPLLRRLLRMLAWMWPKNRLDHLRLRIALAGHPGGLTSADFIGTKGWCLLLAAASGVFLGYLAGYQADTRGLLLLGMLMLISFFLPDVWLSRQITLRQREITHVLPDMLDMLVVTMEAGLSFENALLEITARWRNTLSLELLRLQRDLGVGLARRQALIDLSARTGSADIASFVTAINQAEELGVSIKKVLSVQADELRVKRRQRSQESANKAPIKMLFPMVFLIFPALFAILLGPAVPEILRVLGGL